MAAKKLTAVSYVYKKNESGERVPVRVDSLSEEERQKVGKWLTESLARVINEQLSQDLELLEKLIEKGVIFDEKDVENKRRAHNFEHDSACRTCWRT